MATAWNLWWAPCWEDLAGMYIADGAGLHSKRHGQYGELAGYGILHDMQVQKTDHRQPQTRRIVSTDS